MQVIRGDSYQSWVYSNRSDLVVVDPWLTDKQVFPGLNWLLYREANEEPHILKHNLISQVSHIIITAHFSDHLDLPSLKLFPKNIPIFTTIKSFNLLSKNGFLNITVVQPGNSYKVGSFSLEVLKAGKPYETTTFAYLLSEKNSKVFHEPHMFNSDMKFNNIDACILTLDKVKVLNLVQVSMDINQSSKALTKLSASYILPTGIAPKKTHGLISYLLAIKENYNLSDHLPCACKNVGDSLIL